MLYFEIVSFCTNGVDKHKGLQNGCKNRIANYFIQNSIHKAAVKFGVDRKSFRKWTQQLP